MLPFVRLFSGTFILYHIVQLLVSSSFLLPAVVFFLFVCQRMSSIPFFTDLIFIAPGGRLSAIFFDEYALFAYVTLSLSSSNSIYRNRNALHYSSLYTLRRYPFKRAYAIFGLFSFLGNFVVLDLFVIITAISLLGCVNKRGVNGCSLTGYQAFFFKHLVKYAEQLFTYLCIGKGVFKISYCLIAKTLLFSPNPKNLIKLSRSLI